MPANKYALLRYRIIDRCLTNKARPYPSREALREACEEALFGSGSSAISLSTIDKDIWAMKNEGELGYYAPIAFSREHKGYFYEDPEYSIAEMSLGDDDLEALRFAVATLDQFREVPIFKHYENALEKIISRVNISPNPDDKIIDKFIQFETSTVSKGREHLGTLLKAIQEKKEVRISYLKFSDDQSKEYVLHPYLLKEYDNRWYVIAFHVERKRVATFGLERIESIKVLKSTFTIEKHFDADVYFKHSIGITEDQSQPQNVVLDFDFIPGKFLITQPIHHSQQSEIIDEKTIRIRLQVLMTQELYALIMRYGKGVKVVQPSSLVKEIKQRLSAALHRYDT